LESLNKSAEEQGLQDKVTTLQESMDKLPFNKEEFDIIWSEGAIYNIGFENGIKKWKEFLKNGGYLVLSEITWISQNRPKELNEFWTAEYTEINTASIKINQLEINGFSLMAYFYLSPESWIENFYNPLSSKFDSFLKRNNYSELAQKVIQDTKTEIEFYNDFKEYFSYGFYIARKD